jgi:hypothetical protein
MRLATHTLRRKHIDVFYEILREIPPVQRQGLLSQIHVSPSWMRAVQDLRFSHKVRTVEVTLLSRNCADVVREWVQQHRAELAAAHIHVATVIANKPLNDAQDEFVREYDEFRHIDRAGFGQLHLAGKLQFLNKQTVYLGDAEEESLRGLVGEFVRV